MLQNEYSICVLRMWLCGSSIYHFSFALFLQKAHRGNIVVQRKIIFCEEEFCCVVWIVIYASGAGSKPMQKKLCFFTPLT